MGVSPMNSHTDVAVIASGRAVANECTGVGTLRQLLDARDAQFGLLRLTRGVLRPMDAHLARAEHEATPAVQTVPATGTRRAPRREMTARTRLSAFGECHDARTLGGGHKAVACCVRRLRHPERVLVAHVFVHKAAVAVPVRVRQSVQLPLDHLADEVVGRTFLPRRQARQLFHAALGALDVGAGLEPEEYAPVGGAGVHRGHWVPALAVASVVRERQRTSKRARHRGGLHPEQRMQVGVDVQQVAGFLQVVEFVAVCLSVLKNVLVLLVDGNASKTPLPPVFYEEHVPVRLDAGSLECDLRAFYADGRVGALLEPDAPPAQRELAPSSSAWVCVRAGIGDADDDHHREAAADGNPVAEEGTTALFYFRPHRCPARRGSRPPQPEAG